MAQQNGERDRQTEREREREREKEKEKERERKKKKEGYHLREAYLHTHKQSSADYEGGIFTHIQTIISRLCLEVSQAVAQPALWPQSLCGARTRWRILHSRAHSCSKDTSHNPASTNVMPESILYGDLSVLFLQASQKLSTARFLSQEACVHWLNVMQGAGCTVTCTLL
jgi:hypothetical protein